nr:MAG TPA: hypothetical protein [Caudoviricetes sp.]
MEQKYGKLLTPDIKLHRKYFDEMVKLLGIQVIYRAPRKDKHWTTYSEISSNYKEPLLIGCIFEEHPTQSTMKKRGWVSELQTDSSFIDIAYDTPDIQVGALFIVPSGLDDGKGRLFRCVTMQNSMIYPAAITCEIVPEYENTNTLDNKDYQHSSFNLLNEEEGYEL